jgi:hypothetical protein
MSFRYPSELRFESLNKHSEEQVLERTEVGKQIKFTCKSEKKEKSRSKEAAALQAIRKFLFNYLRHGHNSTLHL